MAFGARVKQVRIYKIVQENISVWIEYLHLTEFSASLAQIEKNQLKFTK
jgi:hypothetical protein